MAQRIQSLDRGLQILEFIAEHDEPVRLGQIAELLGVEKSSAQRLAATLADRGYVARATESDGYLLGDRVFHLAARLAERRQLQECARQYLTRLARGTSETAHLAVRNERWAVLVDDELGSHVVGVTSRSGASEPLHCTALGKALLAGMTDADLRQLFGKRRLKRYTERTITNPSAFVEHCQEVSARLLATDDEEFRPGVRCLASPVFDFSHRVVAAIGISGPAERLLDELMIDLGERVKDCAAGLSRELGHAAVHLTGDESQ